MDQPQAVIDGLLAAPRAVEGVVLHPVSLAHYLLLVRRGHRAVLAENPEMSAYEWLELAYVLARPSREAVRADAAGDNAWAEEVISFGESVPLTAWPALRAEVQRSLREAFAAAPREDGGAKKKKARSSKHPASQSRQRLGAGHPRYRVGGIRLDAAGSPPRHAHGRPLARLAGPRQSQRRQRSSGPRRARAV